MTLLYTDPLFLKHDTSRHPETADRLRSISARLEKVGLSKQCMAGDYKPLSEEKVAMVHAPKQLQAIKQLAEHGGGHLDADTVVSPESFSVALAAAGACVAAADAVGARRERVPDLVQRDAEEHREQQQQCKCNLAKPRAEVLEHYDQRQNPERAVYVRVDSEELAEFERAKH